MEHLKYGTLVTLESIWGHAAGSGASKEDNELLDRTIAAFLERN